MANINPDDLNDEDLDKILSSNPQNLDEEDLEKLKGEPNESEEVENLKLDEDNSGYTYSLPVEDLPSGGLLYDFDYVEARAIQVREEKKLSMITQAQNLPLFHAKIREVVQACIKPDLLNFTMGDQMALFLFLRFQTFGKEYTFRFECSNCEFIHPKYRYDLTELDGIDLDDSYTEPTIIETDEKEFKLRLLRIRDKVNLEAFLKKHKSEFDMTESELNVSAHYAGMLQEATGMQSNSLKHKINYIENELSTKEFALIRAFSNRYYHDIDMTASVQCPDCDQVYDLSLPIRGSYQEFYYPSPENIVNLDDYIQ